ncbi:MAG: beta-galactosidase [Rikenellaceae bacterium]|nr:beta-galactosidase [Rikenellaceae bacterium]
MKKTFLAIVLSVFATFTASAEWKIAGDKIRTEWAEQVNPENVLPEYPRPQLVRGEWQNLNGLWNYAITDLKSAEPTAFDGEILVPFAVESALSGVGKWITENQLLWYEREFTVPSKWLSQRVMLNFGAVDWKADVFVNDVLVGSHTGGFTPFSMDITPALKKKGAQKLVVRVWDPTEKGEQPVGKQLTKLGNIWYTPVSGIWQTVWLEPVSGTNHIEAIYPESDIYTSEIIVKTECANNDGVVEVEVYEGDEKVAAGVAPCGVPAKIYVPNAKLWDTTNPFLYDLKITLKKDGKVVESVTSYTAMRKIGKVRDEYGHLRATLNDKPIFMYGPLDQGWWPDGLYTAPTDEALVWDIKFTKDLGFNTIRKHIKVEPARWFYHCDKLGMLVWQDMPSGEQKRPYSWSRHQINGGSDTELAEEFKLNYYKEWGEIIDYTRFFQSVVVWVPFNEAWSQFDTEKVVEWTYGQDRSRLVNPASGGNLRECGDIMDWHNYPGPCMGVHHADYVLMLGEYGGIGLPIKGHLWNAQMKNWGYGGNKQDIDEVTNTYVNYAKMMLPFVQQGLSGAIYTQTTDVEGEVNGFVTYDRKVVKMDVDRVRKVNQEVINTLK